MIQRLVQDLGGDYVFCDTDSMCICDPQSDRPDLIGCKVVEKFRNLWPYEGEGSLLAAEECNWQRVYWDRDTAKGNIADDKYYPLYCYAIASKRYCLFNLLPGGKIVFRKLSEHGLGHFSSPTGKKGDLIRACWEYHITAPSGKRYIRHENITDWALNEYRKRYGKSVTKEDIFYYVYGLLHSPEYRKRFKNDLKKMLPRIPFVALVGDFWAFSQAGRKLAELHLNYETIEPWPLEEQIKCDPNAPATYKIAKMRFGKTPDKKEGKTVIVYNDHITLRGIPPGAYDYIVNGKSAIEWIIDRYQVHRDKKSGIVNDTNKWLEEHGDPRYIVDLIKRIVRVSIETMKIINELPALNI